MMQIRWGFGLGSIFIQRATSGRGVCFMEMISELLLDPQI